MKRETEKGERVKKDLNRESRVKVERKSRVLMQREKVEGETKKNWRENRVRKEEEKVE